MKKAKRAITHAVLNGNDHNEAIRHMNATQRADATGSASDLFFRRNVRPGMICIIPKRKVSFSKEHEIRGEKRQKPVEKTQKLRAPKQSQTGQVVLIKDPGVQ